jgi:hypothetical protein
MKKLVRLSVLSLALAGAASLGTANAQTGVPVGGGCPLFYCAEAQVIFHCCPETQNCAKICEDLAGGGSES